MTVIARRFVSDPVRLASATWLAIVDLLAPEADNTARPELLAVTGIVCPLIADRVVKDVPIIVVGSGPRVRIYCLYGDAAVAPDDANEAALVSSPFKGDWYLSLPCPKADLAWVQAALKKHSTRITARDMDVDVDLEIDSAKSSNDQAMRVDREAFLRS